MGRFNVRPCDIPSISTELRSWWDGIDKGEIKFVPALPMLREFIPAYIPGHMIVVSGYTSAGKSQLLSQIKASASGVENQEVIEFSLEDSRMEKLIGVASVITGVHKREMLLGEFNNGAREQVEGALDLIKEWPLTIYDDVRTLGQIVKIITERKPKIAIIDYIQRLRVGHESIYKNMSEAAGVIFDLAQDIGTTMIVASQISVSDAKENDSSVISLKGAGEIAEAAHAVIQLRKGRKEGQWHEVEIGIKKNKAFGKCGEIKCTFNNTWTEIVPEPLAHVGFHSDRLKSRGKSEPS
jgi:replicative DNA helicase